MHVIVGCFGTLIKEVHLDVFNYYCLYIKCLVCCMFSLKYVFTEICNEVT